MLWAHVHPRDGLWLRNRVSIPLQEFSSTFTYFKYGSERFRLRPILVLDSCLSNSFPTRIGCAWPLCFFLPFPLDPCTPMIQSLIPMSARKKAVHSCGDTISFEDFSTWQRLARHVARRYGHCFCKDFVFSEQVIRDVAEHISGIAVAEAVRNFDPSRGAKFTTFLYRILRFHAIKEYRSLLFHRFINFDSDSLLERESFHKGFEQVETADAIDFYSTVPDSEIESLQRRYLPMEFQNMAGVRLKRTLGELDREILQRLNGGETHGEIRRDFEQRRLGGRKFFRARCKAIARRGKMAANL